MKLDDDQRTFIVKALACFDTPTKVVAAVKEEFGIDIERQQVHSYDPTKAIGARQLKDKWKVLFHKTRKAFLEDTSDIAISHRSSRIRRLDRMSEKAESSGNLVLAASLMEQAAKEMGESYTNRREITGAGGGPISTAHTTTVDVKKLSDSALEEIMAAADAAEEEGDDT